MPETSKVISWHILEKDGKFSVVQILEDGTACRSKQVFSSKVQAEYYANPVLYYGQLSSGSAWLVLPYNLFTKL